jgi:hypothetical protein
MQKCWREEEGFEFSDSGLQCFWLFGCFFFKKIVFYCKFDFAILLILWTILPNFFWYHNSIYEKSWKFLLPKFHGIFFLYFLLPKSTTKLFKALIIYSWSRVNSCSILNSAWNKGEMMNKNLSNILTMRW